MFRKKQSVAAAAAQLRGGMQSPFGAGLPAVPPGEAQLYRAMRQSLPVLDAAIGKLVRLSGGFTVRSAQQQAAAVNLLYFLPTAAMGVVSHARNGLLEKDALRSAIPWGAAAAIAGALVAAAVDTDLLRRPFGIYLLLAAGITLRQLWRDRKG